MSVELVKIIAWSSASGLICCWLGYWVGLGVGVSRGEYAAARRLNRLLEGLRE